MNSKEYLANEAERLYLYEFLTTEEIAQRLNVSRRTITTWKEKGDWTNKRKKYLQSKQTFHEELYELARKLMNGIAADIDAGEKVEPGRMYAFCRMLPMFVKVKSYEDLTTKKETKKSNNKGLTDDIVAQIEEDILGITPNDRNSEEK